MLRNLFGGEDGRDHQNVKVVKAKCPHDGKEQLLSAIFWLLMPDALELVHVNIALHAVFNSPGPLVVVKGLLAGEIGKLLTQHHNVFLLQIDEGKELAAKVR